MFLHLHTLFVPPYPRQNQKTVETLYQQWMQQLTILRNGCKMNWMTNTSMDLWHDIGISSYLMLTQSCSWCPMDTIGCQKKKLSQCLQQFFQNAGAGTLEYESRESHHRPVCMYPNPSAFWAKCLDEHVWPLAGSCVSQFFLPWDKIKVSTLLDYLVRGLRYFGGNLCVLFVTSYMTDSSCVDHLLRMITEIFRPSWWTRSSINCSSEMVCCEPDKSTD